MTPKPWTPSNRACTRMCGVLLLAHRQGRIELTYQQALRVREGCFSTRFHSTSRTLIGRIWAANGGSKLLEITGKTDQVAPEVREELAEAEQQSA